MSETKETALTMFTNQMELKAGVDMDAIVSVSVSKAEEMIRGKLKAAKDAVTVTKKDYETALENLKEFCEKEAEKKFGKSVQQLNSAWEGLGRTGYKLALKVSILLDGRTQYGERREPGYSVSISETNQRNSSQSVYSVHVDFGDSHKKVVEAVKDADKARTDAQNEAVEWKRKLSDVPTLERTARARLAEAKISSVDGGAEILSRLTADIEEQVNNL